MYDAFFAYARERYEIMRAKNMGARRPWTTDPILGHYKFCNVFREDDRTTIWLRQNVSDPIKDHPHVLLATILFRWFNRVETGAAIFGENGILDSTSPWHTFVEQLGGGETETAFALLKNAIIAKCGSGPYVTGAYCIIGMPHMPKIDGILACVRNVTEMTSGSDSQEICPGYVTYLWDRLAEALLERRGEITLEAVWDWFRRFPRSGDFMAYELVTDLRYTHMLDRAPDIMTWANAGPGAIRGLNRIWKRPLEQRTGKRQQLEDMRAILHDVRCHWPMDWPEWDMRTVEHTLCEFDKYERIRLNEGRVKGVYR